MLQLLSFSYKKSSVETRSKLSNLKEHYSRFINEGEVLILTTCNRVEFYLFSKHSIEKLLFGLLKENYLLSDEEIKKAKLLKNEEVIRHVFRLLSSLESMVIGETQITGQVKEAFMESYEEGYARKHLSRIFHFAFKCAKKVRNSTLISEQPVSVASVAVKKAKELTGSLAGYSAIVAGVGETSRIVCKNLIKENINILLANRSIENAVALKEELGEEVNIEVHTLDKLPKLLNSYRLLFTATASNQTIIKKEHIEEKKFHRLWFDLAMPKDIETIESETIDVINVDDLREMADENMQKRNSEVERADAIIEGCVREYQKFLDSMSFEPVIKAVRQKAQESADQSIDQAIKNGYVSEEMRHPMRKILNSAFKRFLHTPTLTLKEKVQDPEIDVLFSALKKLYKLEEESEFFDMNRCEYNLTKGNQ